MSATQPSSAPLIKLSDIHLTLQSEAGPVNILRGIDLAVETGEAVGMVGPSGSGKSTLLMVLAGLERPTSGVVRAAGRVLTDLNEDKLAEFRRDNVGVVFQSFHLVPTMTALENVAVPLELAGREDALHDRLPLETVLTPQRLLPCCAEARLRHGRRANRLCRQPG